MRMGVKTFNGAVMALSIIALSGVAFAGQAAPAAPAKPATKTALAKPAKAKTTAITATGTVSKFDAASNTLTVTTSKGDVMFVVGTTATVTADGKKVMASDLPSHVGHKVTVRYTESGGQKMAESVRVTMAATASTKKAGTTKKS
jgi:phage baseplate assembly protein gpV